MGLIYKMKKAISQRKLLQKIHCRLLSYCKWISDEKYIKIKYKMIFKEKLDLKNPETFNEKLQWLKLYDRKSIYNIMVDKHLVKDYVANLIGTEYIIPTLGVWNSFNEIDFDKLPNEFVLKCSHDSGSVFVIKDKKSMNISSLKKEITSKLNRNFYYQEREWPYKDVKPCIIAEEYKEDSLYKELRDYKLFVFNGKVKLLKIDFDRFSNHGANYFDVNGNLLDIGEEYCPPNKNKDLNMPYNLPKMIEFAEKLANEIDFLRVDFYEVDNKIYFGELTFYPMSGFGKFLNDKDDLFLGGLLNINKS